METGTREGISRIGVSLEPELLDAFDAYIACRHYPTRSEAVRDLIRERLVRDTWSEPDADVIGTVTLVYDHHAHNLTNELNVIQHEHHSAVVCTTHVHLNAHDCLEVTILRGKSKDVEDLANRLIARRGVKHGQLVCTVAAPEHTHAPSAPQAPLPPHEHPSPEAGTG